MRRPSMDRWAFGRSNHLKIQSPSGLVILTRTILERRTQFRREQGPSLQSIRSRGGRTGGVPVRIPAVLVELSGDRGNFKYKIKMFRFR